MTREEMLNIVIRTRGFEDTWTVWFAHCIEDKSFSHSALVNAMIAALAMPFAEDEEEEDF